MARCYACQRELPPKEFSPDRSKSSGRKSICRECDRKKLADWYQRNRHRRVKPPLDVWGRPRALSYWSKSAEADD